MNIIRYILLLSLFFSLLREGKSQVSYKTGSPQMFPGLVLWLGDSVDVVGGQVQNWWDKSGNGFNAKQLTATKQPARIVSEPILNNQPLVRFDGSNDYLEIGDSLDPRFKDLSIFIVGKSNATLSVYVSKDQYQYVNGSYAIWYASDKLRFKYTDGASKEATSAEPSGSYELISAITDRDAGTNSFYKSGSLIASRNGIANKTVDIDNAFSFMVGATLGPAPAFFLNGDIAEIIIYDTLLSDSSRNLVEQYLRYKYAPPVDLGADFSVPYGYCDTVLSAGTRFTSFLWNTGDTTETITVSTGGTYSVSVTDIFGYTSVDTIQVAYPTPIGEGNVDTTICLGSALTLTSYLDNTGYDFLWSDNSTDSLLTTSSPGDYWVKVTDTTGCFSYSDTTSIVVDSFSVQTSLGPDKTVCQGERINLVSGQNINSYLWSTTDTTNQAIVDTAGLYWIQVINTNGCLAQDTIQITVNGIAPSVLFQVNDTCDNEFSTFNNNSFTTDGSNITDVFWDFGTGDTSSVINPQYQYPSTGLFNVELVVNTDSGCSNSIIKQIQIREKPTAGFFPSSILICSNQSTLFNDNSFSNEGVINSWNWDFGDTSIADTSSLQNGVYSFSSFGSYNVQLIVTTEYGCKDTVAQFVNVKQSPAANFSSEGNCVNQQVKFTNASSGNLFSTTWDFGDANSSSLTNPNHTYSLPNNYNVVLVVKDLNGCFDTLQNMITISDNPSANFIPDDVCVLTSKQFYDSSTTAIGTITDWFWDVRNYGYTSTNQNPLLYFNEADSGIYQLKLRVTNNYGCSDSLEKDISVHPLPQPNFSFSPEVGSPPLLVQFTNLSYGGNSYLWDFGDGIISSAFSPNHTYNDSSVLDVTLVTTSLYGCIDSMKKTIQVIEPVVDIAINNVSYSFVSGTEYMKVIVQLANYGIVDINNVDLQLSISKFGNTLEKWIGNLPAQMQQLYTLNTFVEIPRGEIPGVICVEAINPNASLDVDLSNNKYCKTLNKFELINVYPNPVSQYVTIEYILPAEKNIEIFLNNSLGEKVYVLYEGLSSKGLNIHHFNLGTYSNGVYIIELKDGENTFRKKIIIN